ncbi:50S ribosomal protein L30 [bacterium BMS3Bbin06]|nr:50S ribosomal protein L30 [bacterium BMS3Abin08]GBE34402.1 50S ribosomal protein L30 [bacterium BMS3Bbin06]HDH01010.1 50S ribosomal protein L30 [Nitrospirota bacterium]HDO34808.1 50S ribosomal protein L30 [Nitrospirota bacterium]HDY72149.1 50S ribosomal protein L30 [Nitrospirota bacterium]
MLKVTLKRSYAGNPEKLRRVLRSLGLRKIGHSVIKPDDPVTRGMINKVPHLVEIREA